MGDTIRYDVLSASKCIRASEADVEKVIENEIEIYEAGLVSHTDSTNRTWNTVM